MSGAAARSRLPGAARAYVRYVDWASHKFGLIAMYLVFLMIGVLMLNAVARNVLNVPLFWCIEMAQFALAAYYTLGGAHSLQLGDHVRMDLLYERFSIRGKARMDAVTSFALLFYLVALLIGAISSTIYAIETDQRNFSMWNPSMIPIKVIMTFGIFLTLLQAASIFLKDLDTALQPSGEAAEALRPEAALDARARMGIPHDL